MADKPAIIIIKRKVSHAGHHGGAWKVAYANFVTALMALFIVLWLMNTSKQIQEAVGGYFKDPTGTSKLVGSNLTGSGENFSVSKNNLVKLKEELEKAVRKISNFDNFKNQITMTVTAEGLRIDLIETANGTFFEVGSKEPSENGKSLLKALAVELGKFPNKLSIEGHTDSLPYGGDQSGYSNWELSADRANETRKIIQANGVRPDQVSQVRGFADQMPKLPNKPEDPSNRRISMIIQYLPQEAPPAVAASAAAGKMAEQAGAKPEAAQPEAHGPAAHAP
jgi:chemotaxis protein MotB